MSKIRSLNLLFQDSLIAPSILIKLCHSTLLDCMFLFLSIMLRIHLLWGCLGKFLHFPVEKGHIAAEIGQ